MRLFRDEKKSIAHEVTEEEFKKRIETLPEEDVEALSSCFVSPTNLGLLLGANGRLSEEERETITAWADEARADTERGRAFKLVVSRQDDRLDGELELKHVVTVPTQPLVKR